VNEKQSRLAKASFISRYFVSGVRTPILSFYAMSESAPATHNIKPSGERLDC
jgi:hypothetical protein